MGGFLVQRIFCRARACIAALNRESNAGLGGGCSSEVNTGLMSRAILEEGGLISLTAGLGSIRGPVILEWNGTHAGKTISQKYFGRNDTPTIGWVLNGDGDGRADTSALSAALENAVQRRAPWLRGRLARTQTGSPLFEIHVPPASDVEAFSESVYDTEKTLSSVISYIPNGTLEPTVDITGIFDRELLNPRSVAKGVEDYIQNDLPLLHLHFIKAADATMASLSWSHAAMDASGCAQLVLAWEEELSGAVTKSKIPHDPDMAKLFDFTEKVTLDPDWSPPGWIQPSMFDYAKLLGWYTYLKYACPHAEGSIFIPKGLVQHWKSESEKELADGEWVSSNDLIVAWVFKHGWGCWPDNDLNTLFTAICFRGRHPLLPQSVMTNTAKSFVTPPMTSLELRSLPLAQVALRLRQSTLPFSDPTYVEKSVAYEHNAMKNKNGSVNMYPIGAVNARPFGVTAWAKLGLGSPKFGKDIKVVSWPKYPPPPLDAILDAYLTGAKPLQARKNSTPPASPKSLGNPGARAASCTIALQLDMPTRTAKTGSMNCNSVAVSSIAEQNSFPGSASGSATAQQVRGRLSSSIRQTLPQSQQLNLRRSFSRWTKLSPLAAAERARQFHFGREQDAANRWQDKSIQFVVWSNGTSGIVGEHTMLNALTPNELLGGQVMAIRSFTRSDNPTASLTPMPLPLKTSATLDTRILDFRAEYDDSTATSKHAYLLFDGYG
ncbi:hypothetical protein V493_01728 [Pseudogymnoascus sp. VKM F-4281 (FW-2241)]|nr:hypothetical protein V493_01728 [Pseudogymnoascus sp. VKM F-4281 (FW-2241)]